MKPEKPNSPLKDNCMSTTTNKNQNNSKKLKINKIVFLACLQIKKLEDDYMENCILKKEIYLKTIAYPAIFPSPHDNDYFTINVLKNINIPHHYILKKHPTRIKTYVLKK